MKRTKTILQSGLLLGASLILGCDDKAGMTSFFGPEDQSRRVFQVMNAQANNGAREDGTLYQTHFTGGKINSLGATKLARLVPDDADTMVEVYLDVADNELTALRKDAVTSYLHACGVDDAHLKLALGSNPHSGSPSATGLTNLSKADTGSTTGGAAAGASSGGMPAYAPQGTSTGLQQ